MRRSERWLRHLWSGCLLVVGCRGGGEPPRLDTIADQLAAVGHELTIELRATDPDGDRLTFDFSAPIPQIHELAAVAQRPDGTAVFRWTPRATHLGTWAFDFYVSDGGHTDVVTATIEVREVLGGEGVPIFREPVAPGATLMLDDMPCIDVPIVVGDEDDTTVTLDVEPRDIDGATLEQTTGLTGLWSWCPNKEQINIDRYPLVFSADDGEHDPALKPFLIVLRGGHGEDCPGQAPRIEHEARDVATLLDIALTAHVTDDLGLKQPPLVYVTDREPHQPLDLSEFGVHEMDLVSGDVLDGTWSVSVPNPVVTGQEGDVGGLWYLISAGDNDDATGSCDHLTDAPEMGTFQISVTHPGGTGGAAVCEPCSADVQCGTSADLCVSHDVGAQCLSACAEGASCEQGFDCSPVMSVSGTVASQCVPTAGTCERRTECVDDSREPNDSATDADIRPALGPGAYNGLISCAGDDDWYRIIVDEEGELRVELSGEAAGHVGLELVDNQGVLVTQLSPDTQATGVSACISAGTYYAHVIAGAEVDQSYNLGMTFAAQSCSVACVDDDFEPDDGRALATHAEIFPQPFEAFDRMLCSGNDDWYAVDLFDGETVVVDLLFDHTNDSEDLDLHFHDADGIDLTPCTEAMPTTCTTAQGQSADSDEHYEHSVGTVGCDPCRFYVRVHGFNESENVYYIGIGLL